MDWKKSLLPQLQDLEFLSCQVDALLDISRQLTRLLQHTPLECDQKQAADVSNSVRSKKEMLLLVSEQMDTLLSKSAKTRPPQVPTQLMKKHLQLITKKSSASAPAPMGLPKVSVDESYAEYFRAIKDSFNSHQDQERSLIFSSSSKSNSSTPNPNSAENGEVLLTEEDDHWIVAWASILQDREQWIKDETDVTSISDATVRSGVSSSIRQSLRTFSKDCESYSSFWNTTTGLDSPFLTNLPTPLAPSAPNYHYSRADVLVLFRSQF